MELVEIMGVMGKDWMIQLPKENVIKLKEAGQRRACPADPEGDPVYKREVWGNSLHFCE